MTEEQLALLEYIGRCLMEQATDVKFRPDFQRLLILMAKNGFDIGMPDPACPITPPS
jgi:hypothetical protein